MKKNRHLPNLISLPLIALLFSLWGTTVSAQDIKIKNKTRFNLAVSVNYLDNDDDWVIEHLVIPSGRSKYCCETDNKIIYYYAVDTHGYGWQLYGYDTYEMNYYNTYVGFIKKRLGSSYKLTLKE